MKRIGPFFQELVDELRERHQFTRGRTASPQNWYAVSAGVSGLSYAAAFAQGDRCRVELYIDVGDEDRNARLFDALKSRAEHYETLLGAELSWERLEGKRACRIAVYREGHIREDAERLSEIRAWLVDRLLAFKRVFGEELSTIADQ